MKSIWVAGLFAAAAVAQNEFPDPDFEPIPLNDKQPLDTFNAEVRPIADAIVAINASVVTLDKAIIAFVGADQIESTLAAADNVLQVITTSNNDIAAANPDKLDPTDSNIDSTFRLVPYSNSLNYYVNHTVVNLVLKKDLAVDLCQGPVVFQAVQDQQSAADEFISTLERVIPTPFDTAVRDLVFPLVEALSSASSAFADQTALPESCSTTTTTTITTTTDTTTATTTETSTETSTGTTTGTTTTTTATGQEPGSDTTSSSTSSCPTPTSDTNSSYPTGGSGSNEGWQAGDYGYNSDHPTGSNTKSTPGGQGPYQTSKGYTQDKMTTSYAYGSDDKPHQTGTASAGAYKPTSSVVVAPYKGAAVSNNKVYMNGVAFVAVMVCGVVSML